MAAKYNLKYYQCLTFIKVIAFLSMAIHPTCADLPSDNSILMVSELQFSEKLSNPCALVNASSLQNLTLTQDQKERRLPTLLNQMKAKSRILTVGAENILRNLDVRYNCTALDLPTVASIPSVNDTSNKTSVLFNFYKSLLNHTARVYYVAEQQNRYSESGCNIFELSARAESLASEMRSLMCSIRFMILITQQEGEEVNSLDYFTEQILKESFINQPLCSRRTLSDCQTVSSTITLLKQLSDYLQSKVVIEDCDESSTESGGLLASIRRCPFNI